MKQHVVNRYDRLMRAAGRAMNLARAAFLREDLTVANVFLHRATKLSDAAMKASLHSSTPE